jgi:type IV secretory pathway ATPase VirB11/archaellum biosynthesis ATPase
MSVLKTLKEVLTPPQRQEGGGRSEKHLIAKSPLFVSTGLPTSGYVAEEKVELLGLTSTIYVTEMRTVYIYDEVDLPERLPDDKAIARTLSEAEKEMARREVDPYSTSEGELRRAVEIIERKVPGRWRDHAPALARLIWRWYYAYGSITPLFLSEGLGITDVLLPIARNAVEVDSSKLGAGMPTNIEVGKREREHLQDVISRRVVPLSAARPFASRFDDFFNVRVTAIVPDTSPMPAYAFRLMRTVWIAPLFVASGGAEPWQMAYLCAKWRKGMHVLAAGLPGSGKTSLINAVLSCTQTTRRLAIIQSVPELRVPQAAYQAVERQSFGAGITDILMAELVQKFGLRANSDVGINELLTETDVRAFVTVAFAGFGAAATIHASNAEEVVLRLLRLGVTQAELDALMPRLYIPVMEKAATPQGVQRRVSKIFAPSPGGHKPVGKEEALADPEVRRWADIMEHAAKTPTLHNPEAWVAFLRQFD